MTFLTVYLWGCFASLVAVLFIAIRDFVLSRLTELVVKDAVRILFVILLSWVSVCSLVFACFFLWLSEHEDDIIWRKK